MEMIFMEERKVFTIDDLMAAIASNATKYTAAECAENESWATTSKFYSQVMEDGHIFNPYLHRRFVPSQFLRMMKYCSGSIRDYIGERYGFVYSIEWLKEEVRKLAFLQHADPIAFDERKRFLTIDDIKTIISHYTDTVIGHVEVRLSEYHSVKISKRRRIITKEEGDVFKAEMLKFNNDIQSVITYETMNELLQDHIVVKMSYDTKKSNTFIEVFAKAGAYYTLKHLVMFEHLSLNGEAGADACAELTNYLDKPADVVYDALIATIAANNYPL
jgi:hypothetical protein